MKKVTDAFTRTAEALASKLGVTDPKAIEEALAEILEPAGGRETQASCLLSLVDAAGVELFKTFEGTPYARIPVKSHRESWPIRSKGFRTWLGLSFYQDQGRPPSNEALQGALATLEGKALFESEIAPVHVRLAEHNGEIFLDLGDAEWRAVRISKQGWEVVNDPPVYFRRPKGLLALPVPERGGSIDDLRPFMNVRDDRDWTLLVAYIVALFRPRGPYPVLPLQGPQGSGKSTFSRAVRDLVDPNAVPLRATPRNEQDLVIAASNGHVLAYDNLSGMAAWLSDGLCRIATGGGFASRALYTDDEEALFAACRPIVANGIDDLTARFDLQDRAIPLNLERIPDEKRRTEADYWAAFEAARPRILGAFLDAASCALRRLPSIRPAKVPRMADFAQWVMAAEPALGWKAGTFIEAYEANRAEATELGLEGDPVASAIRRLIASRGSYSGTAGELLKAISDAETATDKCWPKVGRDLSRKLNRISTSLVAVGIAIRRDRTPDKRLIQISQIGDSGQASLSSSSSKLGQGNDPGRDGTNDDETGGSVIPDGRAEQSSLLGTGWDATPDGGDADDDSSQYLSDPEAEAVRWG